MPEALLSNPQSITTVNVRVTNSVRGISRTYAFARLYRAGSANSSSGLRLPHSWKGKKSAISGGLDEPDINGNTINNLVKRNYSY